MAPPSQIAPLVGCPAYSATFDGRIVRTVGLFELKQRRTPKGYKAVTLKLSGRSLPKQVHPLVLLAFKGSPPQDGRVYTCHHKNRDRGDNDINNLEWATYAEQSADSARWEGDRSCPAKYRAVLVTDIDGEATVYPRLADALAKYAPGRHSSNSTVYKALKSGATA